MSKNEGIAIVGLDCRYPGAHNIIQYWENILATRQQFRQISNQRLNLTDYFSTDRSKVDSTYSQKAAVLQGYHFNRSKYKVSKSTFEQTDMTHWLALDVANGALCDAGFENGMGLDKQRVGVIIGNSLAGEFTRANTLRLRWPYVSKVMATTLADLHYAESDIITVLNHAEGLFKEPFPEPDADMLAGGLSNTIAGRICNYFDFNGGGFTVDGACASSLLAFENGCRAIENGDIDVAIVGGVDLSIDPFEMIGFARNGALAAQEMEVYGAKSAGFWPGEGCGMAVVMRTSDAIRRGAKIYAIIKGWGISSDGNGGITRPKAATQIMAFERAYQRAGYGMDTVALIEGHGTGTTIGDQIELEAITTALAQSGKKENPATVGSVKELIGHTKAAAGVAGVIKACMALKNSIIPPSKPLNTYNNLIDKHNNIIQLIHAPSYWTDSEPMRASVSAMGFGGINVHLTLEQDLLGRKAPRSTTAFKRLVHSYRDFEVFPLSHSTQEGLLLKIARLKYLAQAISRAELVDLSSSLCADFRRNGSWNASIVANTPDHLTQALNTLEQSIQAGSLTLINEKDGIFFRMGATRQKIAFLFPGQGAPVYNNRGVFEALTQSNSAHQFVRQVTTNTIIDTAIAQPAIVESSLESVRLLEQYGVEGDIAIGHSLGEISALSWAGTFNASEAIELARERGRAMSVYGQKNGAMLAVKCSEMMLETLLTKGQVKITGYNGINSYVLGGQLTDIEKVQQESVQLGLHNVRLKVSHAFHTPMMSQAAEQFNQYLKIRSFSPIQRPIVSTVTGRLLESDTILTKLLFEQIELPVQFTQAIESIRDTIGFAFEIGPGNALTRSLDEFDGFHRIAMNYGGPSLKGFMSILSAAFIAGSDVLFEELSSNRFYRHFDTENWELDVLVSPCEKSPRSTETIRQPEKTDEKKAVQPNPETTTFAKEGGIDKSFIAVQTFIIRLISDKTEIPFDIIGADDKLMSQLHINSLAITEVIMLVIKQFNKSQLVFSEASVLANADASIAELSKVIYEGGGSAGGEIDKQAVSFDSVPNWTHVFRREAVVVTRPLLHIDNGPIRAVFGGKVVIRPAIEQALRTSSFQLGKVAVFICDASMVDESLHNFVEFLNQSEVRQANLVALLTLQSVATENNLEPVLRTFQLEVPSSTVLSLTLPITLSNASALLHSELNSATRYKEVHYDEQGIRSESKISVCFPKSGEWDNILDADDVLLATGGGKGITFESILYIGQQTKAKLAIFGRSNINTDPELADNLAKLTANGIVYEYYSVDVCDSKAVRNATLQVQAKLGEVKVLIHGAGINKPKLLNLLTPTDFSETMKVKVEGIKNVIDALNMTHMRLLIGYGSIIAESGMYGNADYAWANDRLAYYINTQRERHPNCRFLTLEWSVWDKTGMGIHLNSIETLRKKGVWPIMIENGKDVLRQIMTDTSLQQDRLIISGRFGNLPTLVYHRKPLPIGRFVTNIRQHTPSVEIVADVNINDQDDPYIDNHVFRGQRVFPTVMILEGITQLTNSLAPQPTIWNFENLTIQKPIFVPSKGSIIIRFIVTRLDENHYQAIVQCEDSNYEVNCFEVTVNNDDSPMPAFDISLFQNHQPLDFDVSEKFYDDLLFHQGPFRRISSFFEISSTASLALANSSLNDKWFGSYIPDTYILGDPGLNDAAIHCHQVCRPSISLLPAGAGQIKINALITNEPVYIRTIETYDDVQQTIIDVYVVTKSGLVQQYWNGLILKQVSGTEFKGNWDSHLLTPFIQYNLAKRYGHSTGRFMQSDCAHLVEGVQSEDNATFAINGYTISLQKINEISLKDKIDLLKHHQGSLSEPYIISPIKLVNQVGQFALKIQ